jgi:phosphatidylinositol alpha-1,6-mannosyltransferase
VANSDFTVAHLERIGIDAKRIHKITPGLDAAVFFPEPRDPELRSRYGIKDELVVMTIARLDPRKGHDRVLRALAELKDCVPSFKYVIVGKGEREAELRKLAVNLHMQDNVIFAGFVATQDLNHYYNMADIMAMPNIDLDGNVEGFGMVFLEANAAGKPVIGGRSGGTIEAVAEGETGFLVDPGDEHELVEALRKLLTDDELRRRMGEHGLRRVRQEFDWDSRAVALRRINAEIAKASPGTSGRDRMASSGNH